VPTADTHTSAVQRLRNMRGSMEEAYSGVRRWILLKRLRPGSSAERPVVSFVIVLFVWPYRPNFNECLIVEPLIERREISKPQTPGAPLIAERDEWDSALPRTDDLQSPRTEGARLQPCHHS